MLAEKLKDQWICTCGHWVDRLFTWCPECCEDRDVRIPKLDREQETPRARLISE